MQSRTQNGGGQLRVQNSFWDDARAYRTLKEYADAKGLGIGELQRRLHLYLAERIRRGEDPLADATH